MTKETDSQTTLSIARDGRDIKVILALIITLQSSTSRNKRYEQCGEMVGSVFLESFLSWNEEWLSWNEEDLLVESFPRVQERTNFLQQNIEKEILLKCWIFNEKRCPVRVF